jgi:hypothetical protein
MNKHFQDALYYVGRAGEHAKAGVLETLDPLEERIRGLTGTEAEPDPSRLATLRRDLRELKPRAEGAVETAIGDARDRLRRNRGTSGE